MKTKIEEIRFETNDGQKGFISFVGQSGVMIALQMSESNFDFGIRLFGTEVDDFCELLKRVQEENMRHYPTEKE